MAEPAPIILDYDEPVFARTLSFPRINSELKELAARWLNAPNATGVAIAHLFGGETDHMICVLSCGTGAPPVGAVLDVNVGISGRCIRENRALRCYDTWLDPRVDRQACESLGIRSLVIAPVCRDSRCIGILEVFSDKPGAFSDETLAALRRDAVRVAELSDFEVESEEIKPLHASCGSARVSPEIAGFGPQILRTQISPSLTTPAKARAESSHSLADVNPASLDGPQFLRFYTEGNRRPLRWIGFAAVCVFMGFSVPKLIRRIHSVEVVTSSGGQSSSVNRSSTVSPAALSTAALHAQAPVEPDSASAVRSLTKQAKSGDVAAQVLLANRYSHGDGVGVDKVKATAWYIVGGANGDRQAKSTAVQISHELSQFEIAQARFNVATMYRDGIGTSPDVIAAYSWFVLAGAAGDIRAKGEQQKLEQRMRPAQLSEARRRAAQWISSHHFRRSYAHKIVAAAAR